MPPIFIIVRFIRSESQVTRMYWSRIGQPGRQTRGWSKDQSLAIKTFVPNSAYDEISSLMPEDWPHWGDVTTEMVRPGATDWPEHLMGLRKLVVAAQIAVQALRVVGRQDPKNHAAKNAAQLLTEALVDYEIPPPSGK